MQRPPRSLVLALAIVLTLASIVAVTPRAAAAQNRPSWTQGDFWVYARTAGSSTSTIRLDVNERTTLTLASGTYGVWRVTTTTTDAGGNATFQDSWIDDSNLGVAKANFTIPFLGDFNVTFDPPLVQAVFPLTTNAQWSLNTTLRLVDIPFPPIPLAYSARVVAEHDTAVVAGTFRAAVIRSPSTASSADARTENHYSEGAGNNVKQESYDGSGNRVAEQELTAYRYQSGLVGLLLIIGGVVVLAAIAIAVLAVMRRRKMAPPPGQYPPPPPQAPPPGP